MKVWADWSALERPRTPFIEPGSRWHNGLIQGFDGRLRGERLDVERFDLLLTDPMPPRVTGPDLARGLVERWPALKVVLMSGYTEDEAVRRGVHQGSIQYLQKPFDMPALAHEVRAALDD